MKFVIIFAVLVAVASAQLVVPKIPDSTPTLPPTQKKNLLAMRAFNFVDILMKFNTFHTNLIL